MASLRLPSNRTNVLIAAAIAHRNGGYFEQNNPPGWITVEGEGRLTIERQLLEWALGRPCPDDVWQSLVAEPDGRVTRHDDTLILVE